jgi:hypothetical protein
MLEVESHVRRKGNKNPTGIIESLEEGKALVRWGVDYNRPIRERVDINDLEEVTDRIYSPDEVVTRQAEEDKRKLTAHKEKFEG